MRITVIPADRLVIVDGVPRQCVFDADPNIHAIQFKDGEGNVEVVRGEGYRLTIDAMAPYVAAWESAAPAPEPEPDPEPAPPAVPRSCTRRQGRLALLSAGLLDVVEAAIEAVEDPIQRRAAQIEYEADTWERSNPTLQFMWQQLGGSPEELDALFAQAVTL